jgi:hypothetical protein
MRGTDLALIGVETKLLLSKISLPYIEEDMGFHLYKVHLF